MPSLIAEMKPGLAGVMIATAFSLAAGAAIRSVSPTEKPTEITIEDGVLSVALERGSTVRLIQDAQKTLRVELQVGGQRVISDLHDCDVPKSIHTDSMVLNREDLRTDEHRAESFTLLFDVGLEPERQFGKLPRIQLTWAMGRLAMALVTRQTSLSTAFSSPLCGSRLP